MTTTKTQANISLRKKKERKWKERKELDYVSDFVSQGQNDRACSRVFHDVRKNRENGAALNVCMNWFRVSEVDHEKLDGRSSFSVSLL